MKNNTISKSDYDNNRVETGMGPMTDRVLNSIIQAVSNNNFREKITQKVVEPITDVVNKKIQPYIYTSIAMYLLLVVLLCVIIYLLIRKGAKQ